MSPGPSMYEYYLYDDLVPIRISFNEHGHMSKAEVPDKKIGAMVTNNHFLHRIFSTNDVQRIDAATFDRLTAQFLNLGSGLID
jgi:hypothetical protein